MDIIIPTKNSDRHLEDCLACLNVQTIHVNVIIVDAHSTDRTREIARAWDATILDEPPSTVKGSRRAVACNEGLRHSKAEFVGFIDDDTRVPPSWAEDLTDYLSKNSHVAGVTSGNNSKPETLIGKAILATMRLGSTHARRFETPSKIDSLPGYNAIYRRSLIPMFREDMGGAEDWELNKRIRDKGHELHGVPFSPVIHLERQDVASFSYQIYGYAWSRARQQKITGDIDLIYALPSIMFLVALLLLPAIYIVGGILFFILAVILDEENGTVLAYLYMPAIFTGAWARGYIMGWLH